MSAGHGFDLEGIAVGSGALFLIAGPCVIESEEHALETARSIRAIAEGCHMPWVFKASYDKANRTSLRSFRGPGLSAGLRILAAVRETFDVPVLTDVHQPADVSAVAEVADVLQIPAFLCRQTDLLVAAGQTKRVVNIKKGQFASPWEMEHAVEKVRASGNPRVLLTERGSSFGYNNLVVDMRSLAIMRCWAPVIFDATHSVQLPGGGRTGARQSGGEPQFIPLLARAAVASGADGIFLEVHENPPQALSDGANALPLAALQPLLEDLRRIHSALGANEQPSGT